MNTNFKLSKKLNKNGCHLKSKMFWITTATDTVMRCNRISDPEKYVEIMSKKDLDIRNRYILDENKQYKILFPTYDILNEVCVKFVKEFFGENTDRMKITQTILFQTQMETTQEETEDYIWEQCKFNNKNK